MKPFIRHTLERHRLRLHELDALLSAHDVVSDLERFKRLTREHADAQAVADAYDRYRQREADLAAALELTRDPDPELAAMGTEEQAQAQAD
ncbi:MAG TPA: PCRF domain-containing protein, partial [Burkholderiaceae bacterium]|nr:PCRF domain-containing protein [Burkholderiaceae bacterium]